MTNEKTKQATILVTIKIVVQESEQYPDGFPEDCESFEEALDTLISELDTQTVKFDAGDHGTLEGSVIKAQLETDPR